MERLVGVGRLVNSPVVVPPGPDLPHPVLPVGVIRRRPPCVPERAAPDRVDTDEQHDHDDAEHRDLAPVHPDALEHPSLAGVTLVAQRGRGVVPPGAVGVLDRCHPRRVVGAPGRRLTAARL